MSYDLHVIAKKQPRSAHLRAFLETAGEQLTFDGALKRDGHLLMTDAAATTHVEVDGPGRIEADDVPEVAGGAIGAQGWLIQLSVKPSTDETWPLEFATHLARVADGVVYDPQQDRVTWPKGFEPRDRETRTTRIDEVALVWYTTWPSRDPMLPRRLLELVAEVYPEVLPSRYGGYEPLPHRFEGSDPARNFIASWVEEAGGWAPMLFWKASRPCLGGSTSMTQVLRDGPPGIPHVQVSLTFDGRALARDPDTTERIVTLFCRVAAGLRCLYAGASVNRGAVVRGSSIDIDRHTETGPFPHADRWIGLPPGPTWLAWFGAPYAELVGGGVAARAEVQPDGSFFLRTGTEPMHADELTDRFPPLPPELITRPRVGRAEWSTVPFTHGAGGPPSTPAAKLPALPRQS